MSDSQNIPIQRGQGPPPPAPPSSLSRQDSWGWPAGWQPHWPSGLDVDRMREEMRHLMGQMTPPYWHMPSWALGQAPRDFGVERQLSEVKDESDKFSVKLDVSQYSPEELEVKTRNNEIVIKGKHEERKDEHGFVSREFSRRYVLPEGTLVDKVNSSLSKDGMLHITAPKHVAAVEGERKVPIEMKK